MNTLSKAELTEFCNEKKELVDQLADQCAGTKTREGSMLFASSLFFAALEWAGERKIKEMAKHYGTEQQD